MKEKLLHILGCPECRAGLTCEREQVEYDEIITGSLYCAQCQKRYPIIRSIPRFVPLENYSSSFGFQWNKFKYTQVDGFSGAQSSYHRFVSETEWKYEQFKKDEWILDGGCGNGRFLEIASRGAAEVVGIDLSNAIDAAHHLFKNKNNIHLIQGSLLQLPFRDGVFDKCYCIGVIQHTPNPEKVMRELPRVVKPAGQLAVTIYEKRKFTMLNGKYFLRHLTKHMNQKFLLGVIKGLAPILFPLTDILFRIPRLGRVFQFMIPFCNYVHDSELKKWRKRYEMAILDTFDALSPAYDFPQTEYDVSRYLSESRMIDMKRTACSGLNMIATKAE